MKYIYQNASKLRRAMMVAGVDATEEQVHEEYVKMGGAFSEKEEKKAVKKTTKRASVKKVSKK